MNLDRQLQVLVENAPQDGRTPQAIAVMAPILKTLAVQLDHTEYYLLQTPQGSWRTVVLSHRDRPGVEKAVIYAFASVEDARASIDPSSEAEIVAVPLPVIHILFQMVALKTVDSLIFFDTPGDLQSGTEVLQSDIETLIRDRLQQTLQTGNNVPPNWA